MASPTPSKTKSPPNNPTKWGLWLSPLPTERQDAWDQFASSCYKAFDDKKTWADAQHACRSVGAQLVSIGSQVEHEWLRTTLYFDTGNTWIGQRPGRSRHVRVVGPPACVFDLLGRRGARQPAQRGREMCGGGLPDGTMEANVLRPAHSLRVQNPQSALPAWQSSRAAGRSQAAGGTDRFQTRVLHVSWQLQGPTCGNDGRAPGGEHHHHQRARQREDKGLPSQPPLRRWQNGPLGRAGRLDQNHLADLQTGQRPGHQATEPAARGPPATWSQFRGYVRDQAV